MHALGPAETLGLGGGVLAVVGMVATPLVARGGAARRVLSSIVVGGLFAATTSRAARRWGTPRAAAAATTLTAATAGIERIGTRTGLPFGRYHYTAALRPQLGGVPVIVPLAWFAMAVPAREAARLALGERDGRAARIALGAAALTAWDLFLDPQMVGEGYWRWQRRGAYRSIPVSNFAGWFLTGLGVMAALELLLPPDDEPDPVLAGEYGYMASMETLGFAAFFRDRLVAAVGGAGMLPVAVAAARTAWRRRHWRRAPVAPDRPTVGRNREAGGW